MYNEFRQRKKLHLDNFDYTGETFVYFITICSANKQPCFQHHNIYKIIIDELDFRRTAGEVKVYCYCIMPDHLHILLSLTEAYKRSLLNWVSAFKRHIAKAAGIKPLWQKNFYEHIVRKEESLSAIAEYILNNPVRKGLVSEWRQYPYCVIDDDLFI